MWNLVSLFSRVGAGDAPSPTTQMPSWMKVGWIFDEWVDKGVDVLYSVHLRRKLEGWVDEFWMDGFSACHMLVSEECKCWYFK